MLAGAQLRAELAENAISIGKMAAALSHEINSPLGALRSSISTLLTAADRAANSDEERVDLDRVREQLRGSIEDSLERIEEAIQRLKQLASLADAEVKPADLNDLIEDVALIHRERIEAGGIRLDFDLERPAHLASCRPQLLSEAFSSLLGNAIQAVNGRGAIGIRTRRRGAEITVTFRDNGRGLSPEEIESIFDPVLKTDGSRVSSGNWSLFRARQIVYEHGGAIEVDSKEGRGTAFQVTLPAA